MHESGSGYGLSSADVALLEVCMHAVILQVLLSLHVG